MIGYMSNNQKKEERVQNPSAEDIYIVPIDSEELYLNDLIASLEALRKEIKSRGTTEYGA